MCFKRQVSVHSLNVITVFIFSWLFTGSKTNSSISLCVSVLSVVVSRRCLTLSSPHTSRTLFFFLIHWKWWDYFLSCTIHIFFCFSSFFSSLSDLLMRLRVSTEFERNGRLEGSRWGDLPLLLPPHVSVLPFLNVGFSLSVCSLSCSTRLRRKPSLLCFSWECVWKPVF